MTIAAKSATHAPAAVRRAKAAVLAANAIALTHGQTIEREGFLALASSPKRTEGIAAFLERRPPTYQAND